MLRLIVIGTVAAFTAATNSHPVNEDIVNEIKEKATTWEPMEVEENPLSAKSIEEIGGLFGSFEMEGANIAPPQIKDSVPSFLDWREKMPSCVHPIRD